MVIVFGGPPPEWKLRQDECVAVRREGDEERRRR